MELSLILPAFEQSWTASGYSPTTFDQYRQTYERLERAGVPLPPDLDVQKAREWVLQRMTQVKASTVAVEVKAIRALSTFVEGTEHHSLRALKIPKYDEPGPQPTATAADVDRMLKVCAEAVGFEAIRDAALIRFFACTGARRSEVANMTTEDLDLDAGHAWLLKTKARRPRRVDITPAIPALRRYLFLRDNHSSAAHPALWLGKAGPLGVQGIGFAVSRRAKAAGVAHLGTHSFRRGLAVEWLRRGGSTVTLKQIGGWKSDAMVARYAKAELADVAIDEQRRLFAPPPKKPGARARRW